MMAWARRLVRAPPSGRPLLRALGCRFALGDFGSGLYRAMVESVHRIAHEMGLRTIAEFVEDTGVLDALRVIGVDYAQGYGTGIPVPFDDWLSAVEEPRLAAA